MSMRTETLEKYLVQIRRIEEHREKGSEKKIRRIYKALLRDLQTWLALQFTNYAEDDELSVDTLQKKGAYARFLEEVEQHINLFVPYAGIEIRRAVEQTYERCYEGMIDAVRRSVDFGETLPAFGAMNPETLKRAVENPISGLTLPDRLEKQRQEVIYKVKENINVGLMNGDRYTTVAKRIQEQCDMSYRKAITTVRTETRRAQEAGNNDAGDEIQPELIKNGFVMVKTWRTMKDERVRPQRPAYKRKPGVKARKKYTAGLRSGIGVPNHVKMEGQTVLQNEMFDLGGGVKAKAPGQSGVAGHDINCRCYASRDIMSIEEYERKTGKKVNV